MEEIILNRKNVRKIDREKETKSPIEKVIFYILQVRNKKSKTFKTNPNFEKQDLYIIRLRFRNAVNSKPIVIK